jgi:hypothetical protein
MFAPNEYTMFVNVLFSWLHKVLDVQRKSKHKRLKALQDFGFTEYFTE